MPHYALEITLTRPLAPSELHQASRALPLAANGDATRLMTLVRAKTSRRAAHRLRQRLATRLPVDVITTHYPRLDQAVRQLLAHTNPAHLLSAVGHALTQLPGAPQP